MTRKQHLNDRAWKYARARFEIGSIQTHTEARAHAFQDGYRAALRDMRKALYKELTVEEENEGANIETWIAYRAEQFLKPVR